MWLAQLPSIPEFVLNQYSAAIGVLNWIPLVGGYSGALVWRGEDPGGMPQFVLKCWPPTTSARRLSQIHVWQEQAAHLLIVPRVLRSLADRTFIPFEGRLWEIASFIPGTARGAANREEIRSACQSVAELHKVWLSSSRFAPCPGVLRRVEVLIQWQPQSNDNVSTLFPELSSEMDRARSVIEGQLPDVLRELKPWADVPVLLHPCIRDLRGEHVLFVGCRVGGIVDYGAMDVDSPAIDLARMLGELAGGSNELFAWGLHDYRLCNPAIDCEDDFIRLLDRAGVLCSLLGWFSRISSKQILVPIENARQRLHQLIARAEHFRSVQSF